MTRPEILPIARCGNTHALLLFATTLSENSILNVLKFRKLISLSESGSQNVRIRFTESGFGIRHYKSNQICSLLLVTDGYRSLQHVTDRYYSFLLLVITEEKMSLAMFCGDIKLILTKRK